MDRQFSKIVGHAKQTPLDIHFFQSPEDEPAEFHVVFDISENGFGLSGTLLPQGQALLGEQVVPGLLAIALEFKADLHAAIVFGLRAFGFERAGSTIQTLIETAFGEVAVFGFVGTGFDVD
jgi:hypothetical protein